MLGWLRSLFKQSAVSDLRNPTAWLADALGGSRQTQAGQAVTPETALTLPIYFAAIRNLSEDVGKLPLCVYRTDGRVKSRDHSHPAYGLLHDSPNAEMSSMAFRELMTSWALSNGTAYAEIVRSGPSPTALWPIHPSRVRPLRTEDGLWYRVRAATTGEEVVIPHEDMFVLHGLGGDGYTGHSVIRVAAEAIGVGLATQAYGSRFFGGSTAINSLLVASGSMPDDSVMEKIRQSWINRYSGPDATQAPAILPPGWDFKRVDISPEDAQAIEARVFQVKDIARVLRMPLSKVGASESGSAGEHERIDYVTDTLMPWFVRWEQEANRKLLGTYERTTHYVKHVVQGLMRGDHAARANYYRTLQSTGVLTINDVRELEDLNPVEGGDTHFVPLNTIPLTLADDYAAATVASVAKGMEPRLANPSGEGGGADNEPREGPVDHAKAQAVAMRFLAPMTQRLAVKEARAMEREATKAGGHRSKFEAWVGAFYPALEAEATDMLAEPIKGVALLVGSASPDLSGWYANHRREAVAAFASGSVAGRLDYLATKAGPEMAEMIVRAQ